MKIITPFILLVGLSINVPATTDYWQTGENFFQEGAMPSAIQSWEQALSDTPPNKSQHIDMLIHLAIAYQTQAHHLQAKTTLLHTLAQLSNIGTREQQVMVYSHLGDILLALQDPVGAKTYLDKALQLSKTVTDTVVLGHLYNNRCNLLSVEEFTEEASIACAKAVEFAQRHPDTSLYLQALNNQVWHLLQQADLPASINTLKTALSQIQQRPNSHNKAFHLLGVAQLALTIEKKNSFYQTGLDIYQILQESLQLTEKYQDKLLTAYANGYLGQLYEQRKRYPEALQLTRQAIFLSQDTPEILYLWEWQRGRILHAQQDLSGAITAHQQALDHLRPIYSHLVKGQRDSRTAFQERIRAVYFSFADVLLKKAQHISSMSEEKTALINQARNILEEMKKAELENYFQDECVTATHETQTSVDDLERHTVVLHPVLLPDRTEILYNLPNGVHQLVIPIEAEAIQKMAVDFRENLQSTVHFRFLTQATTLYNWFIAPLKADLRKYEINTLVIVPDGALRTIPFAALFDQEEKVFLAQQFAVAVAHSLNLTEPRPLPRANISVLLQGLSKGVQNFPPLPYVPREIDQVGRLFAHKAVFLDEAFSLTNIQEALKTVDHNIVHIASHGQFDRDPNKTFLLTYDGKLTMDRLEQLLTLTRHREEAVELLTLSACQTAVGDERAALGLAGVAIKAGARSALASLWFISDASTAQLISEFYQQLQDPSLSKAQALQKAQVKLITQTHFRHPAFWSPFLIIGNWL